MNIPTTAFSPQTSHPVWQLALRWGNRRDRRHLWEWDWSRWLINLSERMGAEYSNFPCDDVPLCMPTPWKWATHTEDEVGLEKTSFLGLEWSGAQARVPLHSHGGFLQALCAVCCQIQGWAWSDAINECITHHVSRTTVTAHLAEWKLLSLCQNRNNHPEKVCPHKMLNVFTWLFHPENIRFKTERSEMSCWFQVIGSHAVGFC